MRPLLVLLLWVPVLAQSGNPISLSPAAPKYLTLSTSASATSVKAGIKVSLFVDVIPNRGIHVYAPGAREYLPITLKLDRDPAVVAGKLAYPKSEILVFDNERVPVFQKPFRLVQSVTLGRSKAGTAVKVAGTLNYQACDDKVCYKPESIPVSWTLTVD